MENNSVKIRINLSTREFEVEGDSSYIEDRFGEDIDEYLALIRQQKNVPLTPQSHQTSSSTKPPSTENTNSQPNRNSVLPDSFGEYFNRFPKSLSIVDKLLVACYYVQSNNSEKVFTLKESVDLLLEQGVKLSNPNAFNKANRISKRIFIVTGKNFRVSDTGVEYLNSLTTV